MSEVSTNHIFQINEIREILVKEERIDLVDLFNQLLKVADKVIEYKDIVLKDEYILESEEDTSDSSDSDYSPPPKYSLGECANKHLKINNEYDNLLKQTWTFSLIPDKPKENINIKPTKTKARSTRRKKNA